MMYPYDATSPYTSRAAKESVTRSSGAEIAKLRAASEAELALQLKRTRRESGEHLAQLRAAGEAELTQVRSEAQLRSEADLAQVTLAHARAQAQAYA